MPRFFRWCVAHGGQLLNGDHDAQIYAVGVSCAAKAKIVAEDEREADTKKGVRALLNFGHTFGHALEAATGYGDLLVHGEAVAIGMVMATALSVRLAFARSRITTICARISLPPDCRWCRHPLSMMLIG